MIRQCKSEDFQRIWEIINDAAIAFKGVIPDDRWHYPYMTQEELRDQIDDGVDFWGYEENGSLIGVMGIQNVQDVTLIRHAYILTAKRSSGIGSALLKFLLTKTDRPVLMGTWAAADWAVRFYEKNGFRMVFEEQKNALLWKYWKIPKRQIETSVVLVDEKYHA